MKVLYFSCHSVLEYLELKLFTEIGLDIFSVNGAYMNPHMGGDGKRPPISEAIFHQDLYGIALQCSKENIHPQLVEWADVIFSMHNYKIEGMPEQAWIVNNWDKFKDKPVVWRSIGQSTINVETALQPYRKKGLKIVRYSPREIHVPNFQGQDAMIRFYQDEEEYKDWNGNKRYVINFSQSLKPRGNFCNYELYMKATEGFQKKVYGSDNQDLGEIWGGCLSYEEHKQELRDNAVYFYTGTQPASYTLGFIEAWMAGIPIVAIGPKWGNKIFSEQKTYEVHELIENGVNGFWSDDPEELKKYIQLLLDNYDLAKRISKEGRKSAVKHFNKDLIKKAWKSFFDKL